MNVLSLNAQNNQAVLQRLDEMIRSRRLPHAILLDGGGYEDRLALAREIARAAVCTGETPACGGCGNCRLAQKNAHPDIVFIDPDGRFYKVEQIRQVRQDAYVLPHQGASRVFVFTKADQFADGKQRAENALLKVLEEPPAQVVFILMAACAQVLLPTTRSRCTAFTLGAPARSHVTAHQQAAEKILESLGTNSLTLLRLCLPYHRDRDGTVQVLEALREQLIAALRRDAQTSQAPSPNLRRVLTLADAFLETARYNVNLPLFWTAFCAKLQRAYNI